MSAAPRLFARENFPIAEYHIEIGAHSDAQIKPMCVNTGKVDLAPLPALR